MELEKHSLNHQTLEKSQQVFLTPSNLVHRNAKQP